MVHCCACKIGPSVLACDLARLADEAKDVLAQGADYLHLDVMDGHFVPNITMGAPVIKCLRKHVPKAFLDCHMMVARPEQWVKAMADAGADLFTFHIEATDDPARLIAMIKEAGMKAGVAVKPGTDVRVVDSLAKDVDMVLVMTVEPGFGGQRIMEDMLTKVEYVRSQYPTLDIEVDGGIAPDTIDMVAKAGANMIVAGSSVFQAPCRKESMELMRQSVNRHGLGLA